MHPEFQKALDKFHQIADRDKDGKITKQDAAIVIGDLQARATAQVAKRTPLGALMIASACAFGLGVLARMIGFPWVF